MAERILRWMLRILLPTLIILSGLLIYWLIMDDVYKTPWFYTILAMVPLMAIVAALALWTLVCWVSKELY